MRKVVSTVFAAMVVLLTIAILGAGVTCKAIPNNANILNTYGNVFNKVGNALASSEILDDDRLSYAVKECNSITVANEMTPIYILGRVPQKISISQAKSLGYYIPSDYPESFVPKLNFETMERMIEACYDKKVRMRGHAFVCHGETPDWYFRSDYNSNSSYVSQEVMDKRLEFYIKSIIRHISKSKYGMVIDSWDVVNDYMPFQNSTIWGWQKIYGTNLKENAPYVKQAFKYAYEALESNGLANRIKLFYNDLYTEGAVEDTVKLINYVNDGKKVCDGIGMQSHLNTKYPIGNYIYAIQRFSKSGFEIQITQLDVKGENDSEQAEYLGKIMKAILTEKRRGARITELTLWGLADNSPWRKNDEMLRLTGLYGNTLLYSNYDDKKPSYDAFLQAYFDAGYSKVANPQLDPIYIPPTPPPPPIIRIEDGWYYIKNVHAQKYLTVKDNEGKANQNVELVIGKGILGQKWYLKNLGNGYVTLKSALGDFMLFLPEGSKKDGANIAIYNSYGGDAQQFYPQQESSGQFSIRTKSSNGKSCLDDYMNNTSDGANVCQWSFTGKDTQLWVFEKANQ